MTYRYFLLLLAGFLFASAPSFAQEAVIRGRVTDTDGEPLLGANVIIERWTIGVATDDDGMYELVVPARRVEGQEVVLTVRFVGFSLQQRTITLTSGEQEQLFELAPDLLNLDEVVVTGVGAATQTKRLGINVESVSDERLQAAPAVTVGSALSGKVAGAIITETSGQPGVSPNITLRGINSLGTTNPLILIDGVQVSTSSSYAGTSEDGTTTGEGGDIFFNSNSRLADIDFNDVERIEVTKGAAASTIYGAQGANGVIQIFTKTGQEGGAPRLRLSQSLSFDETLGDVGKASNHFYDTRPDGTIIGASRDPVTGQWTFPSASIRANTINDNPFAEQTFNQLDDVLRTGLTQRYGASLSGGIEDFTYLLSTNIQDQEGVVETTFQQRNSYRANFGLRPVEDLQLRLNTNYITVRNRGTETGDNQEAPLSQALFTPQFVDMGARDMNGRLIATLIKDDNSTNPLFEFEQVNKDIENQRFIGSVSANYQPVSWLELDYTVGLDHYRYEFDELIRNFEDNEIATLSPPNGRVTQVSDKSTTFTSTLSSFFRVNFDRRDLLSTTHLAFDVRSEDFSQTFARGQGLPPFATTRTLRSTSDFSIDAFTFDFNTFGFLVNERLEWREAVGISGGGRFDYSSAFGEGEEATFFPRGDVYTRLSEFDFWQPLKSPIDEFKLRVAYGEAGIQPGPFDRVLTLAQEQIGTNTGLVPSTTLQNPALRVEESREFEAGADATFAFGENAWLSPLSLSFTYWNRTTENVIEEIDLAPSTGAANILTNGVDVGSSGIDLSLDALVLFRDRFNWRTSVNFGRSKSEIDRISSGEDIVVREEFLLRENEEVGTHFGFRAVRGLDERADPDDPTSDFILDRNGDGEVVVGDPAQNADADGQFVFVNGRVVDAASRQVQFRPFKERLGDASPDFTMGFRNDFTAFRDLQFGFQVDWVQGPDIYNATRQWLYRDGLHADWDKPVAIGDEREPFAAYYQSVYKTNDKNEFFIEDGTYVRLREAYVSYDLSQWVNRLAQGNYFNGFRITVSGRNLLTFTDYTGFDPELSHNGGDPRIRGLDEFTFPNFRTVTVGTTITF